MVEHQRVAVRVREVGHVADAAVDRVAEERHAAGRELGARGEPVVVSNPIDDPRLITVNGSAANVEKILAEHGLGKADYVPHMFAYLRAGAPSARA